MNSSATRKLQAVESTETGAHARSGDAAPVAGYMGSGSAFDDALEEFAVEYADQVQRDYRAFLKAVRQGRINALVES